MRMICILLLFFCIQANAQQKLIGFTDSGSDKQKGLEKQFDALMNAGNLDT